MRVRPITRTSAAEAVRQQLLDLIRSGEVPVGSKLPSEHELARSFNVSRPVIRESLGTLRSLGLIESRSGAGSFVRATAESRTSLLLAGRYSSADLHEVRTEIEVPGAGLAAGRRNDEQLSALAESLERQGCDPSVEQWVRDDLRFHVLLAEATGNALQVRLVTELRELQSEQSLTMARLSGGLKAPIEEHAAILEAVFAQDEGRARAAMAAHLIAIQARWIEVSEAQGGSDAA